MVVPVFVHQVLHRRDRREEELARIAGAGRVAGDAREDREPVLRAHTPR